MTDDQNAVDTGSFSINLTRTNDNPTRPTRQSRPLEGAADSSGNTLNLTGQLTATDIDSDASGLTFSLVDASGAATSIDGLTLNMMDRSRLIQQTAPTTHLLTVNRKSSPSTIKSVTAIRRL